MVGVNDQINKLILYRNDHKISLGWGSPPLSKILDLIVSLTNLFYLIVNGIPNTKTTPSIFKISGWLDSMHLDPKPFPTILIFVSYIFLNIFILKLFKLYSK